MTSPTTALPVVTPAKGVSGPPQGQWTYGDYAAIPDDGRRYEVIEGVLYVMSPSPLRQHQAVVMSIAYHLYQFVQISGRGWVFVAPFDVELAPNTVVEPDVIVVLKANESIIHDSRIIGAPDLVVEVTSPSSANHDRREKLDAYQAAGVGEYWIADPATRTVDLLAPEEAGGAYQSAGIFQADARLPSRILPDFAVPVERLLG
jgi:Uma2 family endonuclease